MTADVSIPGRRSVRGTLDTADAHAKGGSATRSRPCVVACPPHPQHGGHRGDPRLEALGAALTDRGIDCLRIEYGDWDEGDGEREDACNAVRWATDRYDRIGLYGYSFGGGIALLTSARVSEHVDAVATLAPAPALGEDTELSAVDALVSLLDGGEIPIQIVFGERDSTVDSTPLVDALERHLDASSSHSINRIPADHFFVGQHDKVAELGATFLETATSRD
jgi:alpha/beta superfamily hydrolase